MTDSLTELLTIMSKDAEFSDRFLRGVESAGTLNKIETHRYNVFMNVYFLQIQEIWEYDSISTQSRLLAVAMMQTGLGVYSWFKKVGPILFKPELVDHLDTDPREFTTKPNELHRPDNAYAITPPPMLAGIQT